jgi:hypothetical protein
LLGVCRDRLRALSLYGLRRAASGVRRDQRLSRDPRVHSDQSVHRGRLLLRHVRRLRLRWWSVGRTVQVRHFDGAWLARAVSSQSERRSSLGRRAGHCRLHAARRELRRVVYVSPVSPHLAPSCGRNSFRIRPPDPASSPHSTGEMARLGSKAQEGLPVLGSDHPSVARAWRAG